MRLRRSGGWRVLSANCAGRSSGGTSEKLAPEHFNLPLEDVEIAQGVLEAAQEKARRVLKGRAPAERGTPNRNRGHLPKHLPCIERIIEPDITLWLPLERHWSERQWRRGCGEMTRIGDDVSERVELMPAQLRVLVTRPPKMPAGAVPARWSKLMPRNTSCRAAYPPKRQSRRS
jgi:hypothetical protein